MDTVGGLRDDGFRCSNVNVGVSADGWGFADMGSGRVSSFKGQFIGLLHAVQYLRGTVSITDWAPALCKGRLEN